MAYKILARRVGDVFLPATVSVRERGLERFLVPKAFRAIYRNRAEELSKEYESSIIYYPLAHAGQDDVEIMKS